MVPITTINGVATDQDQSDSLTYRWMKEGQLLTGWTPVGGSGECPLNMGMLSLPIGTQTLTLEVSDGKTTTSDDMILTIENSAPHAAVTGTGRVPIGTTVFLNGQVSDYDGDTLSYTWKEDGSVVCSGTVQTIAGGSVMNLPETCNLASLSLGEHVISLEANDGINLPVMSTMVLTIFDDISPTLHPTVDKAILWPPNHGMVYVTIKADSSDNSGQPVTLTASVLSNEPIDGLGDGDIAPDWTTPVINQSTGSITLQLRAERSGSGNGREYTVNITATDVSGNVSTAYVKIIVPHDNKKK